MTGAWGPRPLIDGWRGVVHQGTPESGNLRTVCGLVVKGHWRLADGVPVDCPCCLASRA